MANELLNRFSGCKVLVTGHTGFKGTWLVLWLRKLGAEITGLSLEPPTNPSHFNLVNAEQHLERNVIGDLRNHDLVRKTVSEVKPEVIFHLAAQSVVQVGYTDPHDTFSTNCMGILNLLDAVRLVNRPCSIVAVSTDKCYENRGQVWGYRENDALGSSCPYGASKGAADLIVRSYQKSFFSPSSDNQSDIWLANARAGNVIGGGDWTANALIPDVVHSLQNHHPVELRHPQAIRPWQHVLQCLSGYMMLASRLMERQNPDFCSDFNIGPHAGGELTVAEVVESFFHYWGSGTWSKTSDAPTFNEAPILRLTIDKALTTLGWMPTWDIQETLKQTAAWYATFVNDPKELSAISFQQIEEFESQFCNRLDHRRLVQMEP